MVSKKNLKVISTMENDEHDKSHVLLTRNTIEDLGLLTGDPAVIKNSGRTLKGTVRSYMDSVLPKEYWDDDEIPLTKHQMRELNVSEGSEVTVDKNVRIADESSGFQPNNNVSDVNDVEDLVEDSGDIPTNTDTEQMTNVTYDDIGGLDDILEDIRMLIELPFEVPGVFNQMGIQPPKGVLLHGPPGTGKTLIAKAVANEVDARFIKINGPEILNKFTGESEQRLREIFEDARQGGPAIIFFDEIDSIGAERGGSDTDDRLVNQLLSLMDGLGTDEDVVVLAATNRVDQIDNALRRGGRFDREIHVGVPNEDARRDIFSVHTSDMPVSDEVSIDMLAEQTSGFVGADIAALTREAALESIQAEASQSDTTDDIDTDNIIVSMKEFNTAMTVVDPSTLRESSATKPNVSYEDVGGLTEQKQRLKETVVWPIEYTQLFTETSTKTPTGVLLHGDEGTGKTLLGKAVAGETGLNFIQINSSEVFGKYVGESAERIREMFETAEQAAPCIVFIDQIDSLSQQGFSSSDAGERVISQLTAKLDEIKNNPNLTVISATSNIDNVDDRLLNTGRLEEVLELPYPDAEQREEILNIHLSEKPVSVDVDLSEVAERLDEFSGGDIESVAREASLLAIRDKVGELGVEEANKNAQDIELQKKHFDSAISKHL